jgi:hypothetical protein
MKSADRLFYLQLDDLEAAIAEMRRLFPEAIRSSEDVGPRAAPGVSIRSSSIADPTATMALDPRRRSRAHNLKMARRRTKGALVTLREAIGHATIAAES